MAHSTGHILLTQGMSGNCFVLDIIIEGENEKKIGGSTLNVHCTLGTIVNEGLILQCVRGLNK